LGALARDNGKEAGGTGQFGQLDYHAVPPAPQLGYTTSTFDPWPNGAFGDQSFSHVLLMPDNFQLTFFSPSAYMSDTTRILDYVVAQSPNSEIVLYEHWPEPNLTGSFGDAANLSNSEWRDYRDFTLGEYHDWFVGWQNLIAAEYSNTAVRMIPVGQVITDLLDNEPYMAAIAFNELYADDAPHGSRTAYFLAALICYRAMYLESPSTAFVPPEGTILDPVRNNLPAIISYIDERLTYYNSNGVRVYLD